MMDDILVSGATMAEHDESLCPVLETLVVTGVTLNLAKCAFGLCDVSFSGYGVNATGSRIYSKKKGRGHRRNGYTSKRPKYAQFSGQDP